MRALLIRLVFVLFIVTSGFPLGVFTGPTPAQAVSVRNATIAFIIFILVFRVVPLRLIWAMHGTF
jgi:hypothetical protein